MCPNSFREADELNKLWCYFNLSPFRTPHATNHKDDKKNFKTFSYVTLHVSKIYISTIFFIFKIFYRTKSYKVT